MYLTEIAPLNFRGVFGSVNQFVLVGAILVSQFLGLPYILGSVEYWPLLFGNRQGNLSSLIPFMFSTMRI